MNKLTLLVGASGVGKTQILKALMALKRAAQGRSLNGMTWSVEFGTLSGSQYVWQGKFENKGADLFVAESDDEDEEQDQKSKPKILSESVLLNGEELVERNADHIKFQGQSTVKLPQQQSILYLLKEEDNIKPAYEALKKLHFADHSDSINRGRFHFSFLHVHHLAKKYDTLTKIQESELDTPLKLFFLQKADKKVFAAIKQRFAEVFPQVEDLKVAPLETQKTELPGFLKDYPFIQIKERGIKHWISQNRISSGMFRSLMQLSELYLCPEGSVFLIDEFENSLGINCINEITRYILSSNRKLQFVLTSHHPYIIDALGVENWKLVTRNGAIIKTHSVDKFNIGSKSKHSAFMQLIQLEEYQTGREQA